jgi:type IV secretory pathway VirB2 component (pilin)
MNNFGKAIRLSTDMNSAAQLLSISAVPVSSQTGKEAGGMVNLGSKLLRKRLIVCIASALALIRPTACLATSGDLPWDHTLVTLQDILIGPVAHVAIALVFIGAGLLYAVGGYDKQAGRLAASGIGGCLALGMIRLLNFLFP